MGRLSVDEPMRSRREEYAELLEAAGVDTVRELKYRNPANLAKRMAEVNTRLKLVRALPSEKVVLRWIRDGEKAVDHDQLLRPDTGRASQTKPRSRWSSSSSRPRRKAGAASMVTTSCQS